MFALVMGACSFKALINKENRKNKSALYSIYLRIILNRKPVYLKLDQKIDIAYWIGKPGKWIKDSHPHSFELNAFIKSKIHLLEQFELKLRLTNNAVTIEKLQNAFINKGDSKLFVDYFTNYIRNLKGKTVGTIKNYNTVKRNIAEFKKDLTFQEIQDKMIQNLADYFRHDKNLAHPTVQKTIRIFMKVCRQAVKEGYMASDPFINLKIDIKASASRRVYLDQNEIIKFKNAELPSNRIDLFNARDQWLFCVYASFYYSDLKKLRWDEIKESEYGPHIIARRFKNESQYVSTVYKFKNAIRILEAQRGKDPTLVFPNTISEQKYNDKLKEICKMAGIDKPLNNKAARHSGIQLYISHGLEQAHVSKIAGHKNTNTTSAYYKLNSRDVNEQVKKVDFNSLDI